MPRKVFLIIGVVVLAVGAGAWVYLAHHSNTNSVHKEHSINSHATHPVPHQTLPPTEEITYPDGRTASVIAHQLIARINNPETVSSFGSTIKPKGPSGVYVITVQGDLLANSATIAKKPGVVWVTPIDALEPIRH